MAEEWSVRRVHGGQWRCILQHVLPTVAPTYGTAAGMGGPPETEADWRRVADTLRRLHLCLPRTTSGNTDDEARPGWAERSWPSR